MDITYKKTYGVKSGSHKGSPRFFVVDTGRTTSLHYADFNFAMKKAEHFVKSLYKDFIDFQKNNVHFVFQQNS